MKTKTYKWAVRWKRAVANGQWELAEHFAFQAKANGFYSH